MPIIKSAIKKMRQDKAKEKVNRVKKDALKKTIKTTAKEPNSKNLSLAFSALDKAAKVGLIPKGRANRQKARLASRLSSVKEKTATKAVVKKRVTKKS